MIKTDLNIKNITTVICFTLGIWIVGSTSSAASEDSHGNYPGHIIGGFIGATSASDKTDFTYGIEYELRLSEYFGIGAVVERIASDATVGILAVHFHPVKNLRLTGGIGKEWVDSYTKLDQGIPNVVPAHSETVYRMGVAYDIALSKSIAIAPTYNLDFINGHTSSVFGLVLLTHF